MRRLAFIALLVLSPLITCGLILLLVPMVPFTPDVRMGSNGYGFYQAGPNQEMFLNPDLAMGKPPCGNLMVTCGAIGFSATMHGATSIHAGLPSDVTGWPQASAQTDQGNTAVFHYFFNLDAVSMSVDVTAMTLDGPSPTRTVRVIIDREPPIAKFTDPTEPVHQTGTSHTVAWSASDDGSGLPSSGFVVTRQHGTPAGESCVGIPYRDDFDGDPLDKTIDHAGTGASSSYQSTNMKPGTCYRWTLVPTDNVGNRAEPVFSAPVFVEP
jgi:hypothetical protein